MLQFEEFEEKTLSRTEIFQGKMIEVVLDKVQLPDGNTASRELVFHPGGVGILALTTDGKIVLVKQFRKAIEQVILEIPAGKIDPGEGINPEVTARRELEEETGYRAAAFEFISSMFLSPGFANEQMHIFLASGLEKVQNPLAQDEDELLEIYEMTLEEAKMAILNKEICDAKTLYAIQYWELLLVKGRGNHGEKTLNHSIGN